MAKEPQRDQESPTLAQGNAIHAALERFFGLHPFHRTREALHLSLRSVWREHCKPGTFVTREEERECGLTALALLDNFFDNFDTTAVPLARERWVSARLPNGRTVFGKVDRIDGSVHRDRLGTLAVIDYKTGRHTLDREDVRHEPAAQVYAVAAERETGREVDRVRFLYIATAEEVRWEPEREDIEAATEALVAVTDEIHADELFEARPGPHCGRCPFNLICPDAGRVELSDLEVEDDIDF